jgi:ethanolamine transporter EutH
VVGGLAGTAIVYAIVYAIGGKSWIIYEGALEAGGLVGLILIPAGAVAGNLLTRRAAVRTSGHDVETPTSGL